MVLSYFTNTNMIAVIFYKDVHHPLYYVVGILLLILQCCHLEAVSIETSSLDQHLRSAALSQPRSELQPQNKLLARKYIQDFWNGSIESANDTKLELIEQEVNLPDISTTVVNCILVVKGKAWGTAADHPAVLAAHYDSQPGTPGKSM